MLMPMRFSKLHDWRVSPKEARAIQERLAPAVRLKPLPKRIRTVAGADMSLSKSHGVFFASVLILRLPELEVIEEVSAYHRPTFPYVPGLLSFREGPVLLQAMEKLSRKPDVFLFDGQGIAHPRRFGLASHLGLWLARPSIGCAKSRLVGAYAEPGTPKGSHSALTDGKEKIGEVLRTRDRVKPVFVSPGHLSDFDSSVDFVLGCCTKYRLPEPTRLADIAVAKVKREYLSAHPLPKETTPG
jgi:deoxyribonuclease V